jgi:class 3 adenylate cyclase
MRLGSAALAMERVERRLAAILAADIAGYSRLMGADEEGTLARLKAHRRELIDPEIAEHRGHIVGGICASASVREDHAGKLDLVVAHKGAACAGAFG